LQRLPGQYQCHAQHLGQGAVKTHLAGRADMGPCVGRCEGCAGGLNCQRYTESLYSTSASAFILTVAVKPLASRSAGQYHLGSGRTLIRTGARWNTHLGWRRWWWGRRGCPTKIAAPFVLRSISIVLRFSFPLFGCKGIAQTVPSIVGVQIQPLALRFRVSLVPRASPL
jgi:hypothetical protein